MYASLISFMGGREVGALLFYSIKYFEFSIGTKALCLTCSIFGCFSKFDFKSWIFIHHHSCIFCGDIVINVVPSPHLLCITALFFYIPTVLTMAKNRPDEVYPKYVTVVFAPYCVTLTSLVKCLTIIIFNVGKAPSKLVSNSIFSWYPEL